MELVPLQWIVLARCCVRGPNKHGSDITQRDTEHTFTDFKIKCHKLPCSVLVVVVALIIPTAEWSCNLSFPSLRNFCDISAHFSLTSDKDEVDMQANPKSMYLIENCWYISCGSCCLRTSTQSQISEAGPSDCSINHEKDAVASAAGWNLGPLLATERISELLVKLGSLHAYLSFIYIYIYMLYVCKHTHTYSYYFSFTICLLSPTSDRGRPMVCAEYYYPTRSPHANHQGRNLHLQLSYSHRLSAHPNDLILPLIAPPDLRKLLLFTEGY
jgi:hypothetical protein